MSTEFWVVVNVPEHSGRVVDPKVDNSEYRVVLSEPHATREAAAQRYLVC